MNYKRGEGKIIHRGILRTCTYLWIVSVVVLIPILCRIIVALLKTKVDGPSVLHSARYRSQAYPSTLKLLSHYVPSHQASNFAL